MLQHNGWMMPMVSYITEIKHVARILFLSRRAFWTMINSYEYQAIGNISIEFMIKKC
jgi:hypothetical protein